MRNSEKVKNLKQPEDLLEAYQWLASHLGLGQVKKPAAVRG